jgi:hypothetical protein
VQFGQGIPIVPEQLQGREETLQSQGLAGRQEAHSFLENLPDYENPVPLLFRCPNTATHYLMFSDVKMTGNA